MGFFECFLYLALRIIMGFTKQISEKMMAQNSYTSSESLEYEEFIRKINEKDVIYNPPLIETSEVKQETTYNFEFSLEPISLDFQDVKFIPFKSPLPNLILEKKIFEFIQNNPNIDTEKIINKFKSNDSWEILEILDKMKEEGIIE